MTPPGVTPLVDQGFSSVPIIKTERAQTGSALSNTKAQSTAPNKLRILAVESIRSITSQLLLPVQDNVFDFLTHPTTQKFISRQLTQ